jgi:hypothetical protein
MNAALTRDRVVDSMVAELAERRRTAEGRRAGYVALARAIMADEPLELSAVRESLPLAA